MSLADQNAQEQEIVLLCYRFDHIAHAFKHVTTSKRDLQNNIIGYNYLLSSEKYLATPEGKQREALIRQLKRSSMAVWHHIHMDGEYVRFFR